jgi:hypothetical protein
VRTLYVFFAVSLVELPADMRADDTAEGFSWVLYALHV